MSPKGLDGSSALLDDRTFAYADLGGSGAETIAHPRENGRIALMWCAFTGPPTVVRVHGRGEPVFRDDPRWRDLLPYFSEDIRRRTDLRAVIVVTAERISDSCGFAVPEMDFRAERPLHTQRFSRETEESFRGRADRRAGVAGRGLSPGGVVVGRRSSAASPFSALPDSALDPLLSPPRLSVRPLSDYCAGKPHVGTSLDGLPGLPLPLPPRTS